MSFDIITDASCDLSPEQARALDITILPIGLTVGESSFMHYPDFRELSSREFYSALRAGLDVSTSATGLGVWLDAMSASVEAGRDVIVLPLAGSLTGGYNAACIAAQELREEHPERSIHVIDTICASLGLGLLIKMACRWRTEGMTADEAAANINAAKTHIVHLFTVDSLDHLRRGGRISRASALIGSMLAVKPILNFDVSGKISVIGKVRGRKNSIRELAALAPKQALTGAGFETAISHADCPEDAQLLADSVRRELGEVPVSICTMSPVLAAHAGPGGLALFFVGTRPKKLL
jgi:DegV family protein with EDD domain